LHVKTFAGGAFFQLHVSFLLGREQGVALEAGRMQNAGFSAYEVPRFRDVPEFDLHLLNRTDLPSVGAGETPIIAVAPAIGNAVFHATGVRLREMPMRLPEKLPS
jgi:isoquinoline 1-oxidoreductase